METYSGIMLFQFWSHSKGPFMSIPVTPEIEIELVD